jgi:serine/threonine protein kinase
MLVGFSDTRKVGAAAQQVKHPPDWAYAAPELLKDNPSYTGIVTQETDIYMLGVDWATLLCPIDVKLHPEGQFPGISRQMSDLLKQMLDREPTARPSIDDVLIAPLFRDVPELPSDMSDPELPTDDAPSFAQSK